MATKELIERLNGESPDRVTATDRLRLFAHDPETFEFDQHDAISLVATIEETADALERLSAENAAQAARIAEMKALVAEIKAAHGETIRRANGLEAEAESALAAERERREKAEALLEPFADIARQPEYCRESDDLWVSVRLGLFRAARDFLSRSPDSGGEAESDLCQCDPYWHEYQADGVKRCRSCDAEWLPENTPPASAPEAMTASQAVQHCLDVLDHMRAFGTWDKETLNRASGMIGMLKRDLDTAALARKEAGE